MRRRFEIRAIIHRHHVPPIGPEGRLRTRLVSIERVRWVTVDLVFDLEVVVSARCIRAAWYGFML